MFPSAALCRSQVVFHTDRAANTTLENVRVIAVKAIKAWSQEAILAQQREDRREQTRTTAALLTASAAADTDADDEDADLDDDWSSENPDRGLAG